MALFGFDDSAVVIGAILLVVIAWMLGESRAPASKKQGDFRL
jgi:hypothetical protein